MNDWDWGAPVALTRNQPIAKPEVLGPIANLALFDDLDRLGDGSFFR